MINISSSNLAKIIEAYKVYFKEPVGGIKIAHI